MGDMEEKAGEQYQLKSKGEDKIQNEIIINNPENLNGTKGVKFVGIFGREGLLAALDLQSSESLGSSSSSSGIIKEPTLANNYDSDDKKYQVSSRTAKKINLGTGSGVQKNCYQKDKTTTKNNSMENLSSSLEESVFSIGHILESIVSELDRETLLACHLVSRRWSYFASKALQKIVNIRMVHKERWNLNNKETPHFYFYAKKHLGLDDLIALVGTSPEFPSTSFSFINENQGETNPSAESFFEAHGSIIKKLRFNECVSLSDVKKLLFTQALNLEQLFLNHLRFQGHSKVMNYTPLEETSETNGYRFDASISPRPTLANLKVFKCDSHIPEMFAQNILEWSPNLVEAELPVEYFHLLIKPKNRLHLLKKVDTELVEDTIVEVLELVANHHENNLTLEKIHFSLLPKYNRGERSRAVDVMCKIWEASSASCQKLSLDYCFDLNLVCRMPQLKSLSFYEFEIVDSPLNLLGRWSSIGDKFPKLTTLNIKFMVTPVGEPHFDGPVSAQVLSVKDVYFRLPPHEIGLQRFKEMFPNATLHPTTRKFEDDTEMFDDFKMMFAYPSVSGVCKYRYQFKHF